MGNFVGLYYDANANLAKVVIADDDNYAPHAEQQYLFVQLDKATYQSVVPDSNINGTAVANGLNQAVVNQVLLLNPTIGAKLQAIITATNLALANQGVGL